MRGTRTARIAGLIASAVIASTLTAPTAAPANEVHTPHMSVFVPTVQVYRTRSCVDYPFTVFVDVDDLDTDPDLPVWWSADVDIYTTTHSGWGATAYLYGQGTAVKRGYATMCPLLDGVGRYQYDLKLTVDTPDGDSVTETVTATTYFKAPTKLTANAKPEPVKRGARQYVKGRLTSRNADWKVVPLRSRRVTIQYRRAGSTTWVDLGTVRTSRKGRYTFRTTARPDGFYRATYGGTTTLDRATSAADYVNRR